MKKFIAGIFILALILIMVIAYHSSHVQGELIEETVWRGWQGEAANSKYYVIKQVLAKNGITLTLQNNKSTLPVLSDYDAIIFSKDSSVSDAVFIDELEDWVKNGGRLLMPVQNKLAKRFAIDYKDSFSKKSCTEANQFRWKTRSGVTLKPQTELSAQIVLAEKYKVRVGVACNNQLVVIMRSIAKGKIIAFAHDLWLWSDKSSITFRGIPADTSLIPVANGDNAAYLHDLLGSSKRVLLIHHNISNTATKFNWSIPDPKWWPLIVSLIFAIFALVWALGSRFGPLLIKEQYQRTDIDNHLRAAGRFWESEADYMWLAKASQQRFETDFNHLARQFGSEEAAIAWLVSQTHLSSEKIKKIRGNLAIPKNELAFNKFMSTLEELRRVL